MVAAEGSSSNIIGKIRIIIFRDSNVVRMVKVQYGHHRQIIPVVVKIHQHITQHYVMKITEERLLQVKYLRILIGPMLRHLILLVSQMEL